MSDDAALVEQMAAAAGSLRAQVEELAQVVSLFKLDSGQQGSNAAHRISRLDNPRHRQ